MSKIIISTTNPCHLYDMALALLQRGALEKYYSGYPGWRLKPPHDFPLRAFSWRTVITYSLRRFPLALRPADFRLFRWQDRNFDRSVSEDLSGNQECWLHAMPGQALCTFRKAKELGIRTCLNHASGPVGQQLQLVAGEYSRAGLAQERYHGFDKEYFAREAEEYALADMHCVASSVVRSQLNAENVPPEKIWVVPYAANQEIFHPAEKRAKKPPYRILFAGQLTLRKGLRILLDAYKAIGAVQTAELHLFGPLGCDFTPFLPELRQTPGVTWHGPVAQRQLAEEMRKATVLVLPSWEEAFGLVVPQALSCGIPCIVSDHVGALDLIRHRVNGSIFRAGDSGLLAEELTQWLENPDVFATAPLSWDDVAEKLMFLTSNADLT